MFATVAPNGREKVVRPKTTSCNRDNIPGRHDVTLQALRRGLTQPVGRHVVCRSRFGTRNIPYDCFMRTTCAGSMHRSRRAARLCG
jgi:hypothetical protein